MRCMRRFIKHPLHHCSLAFIHKIGAMMGVIFHWMTPKTAKLRAENLRQSGLCSDPDIFEKTLKSNIRETGKSLLETIFIWYKPALEVTEYVKKVSNWHLVEDAVANGKGIVFLTPHMGCFEITSLYYARYYPITVLFRPPKLKLLWPLLMHGRQRLGVTLAEANAGGVKKLILALKRGEAIGILPDQVPKAGEGVWASFFGKPAYTMTLASKLASKSEAVVIMAFGERLTDSKGYHIHLTKVENLTTPEALNQAIEKQIAQCPSQYLWQYNRYKRRRHALKKLNHE